MAKCPVVSNLNLVSYPFHYRTSVDIPANSTFISVHYPYNNMVGWAHKQAVYPPDNATIPTNGFSTGPTLEDPFLSSVFAITTTVADAVEVPSARATDFCVEVSIVTPLANVGGDCMFGVWRSPNFPNIGAASGYGQAYSQMLEDPYTKVIPGAAFTHPVCVHAAMRDRNALEPTGVQLGPTPYYNVLRGGNNPASTPDYTGVTMPWYPVVLYLANPGATALSFLISVRGTFEINPAVSNAWFRLAVPRQISPVGAEQAWWRKQQKMLELGPVAGSNVASRNISGYIGVPSNSAASTTTATTRKKRLRGARTITTTAPRIDTPMPTYTPSTTRKSKLRAAAAVAKQVGGKAQQLYSQNKPLVNAVVQHLLRDSL